ncbi:MAG: methionine synthase, partial [Sciscionella sp.]
MPGTDADEAARVVVGELPALPHLVELPARGIGADIIGRAAALLVDLAVEVVPTGYRVTSRRGHDHRRAMDLLRRDLDGLHEAVERAGSAPRAVKIQVAGPWTLTAGVELARGHRVLTDPGALREFAESLGEGIARQADEVAKRIGVPVVVQLDEPTLPTVLAGGLSTPSGYGTVAAPERLVAEDVLRSVVDVARSVTGQPVIVHCCAPRPPVGLLRAAGADALGLDGTLLRGSPVRVIDELGEILDARATLFLGLVPSVEPTEGLSLHDAALPALELVDRLSFDRALLATQVVPTPT